MKRRVAITVGVVAISVACAVAITAAVSSVRTRRAENLDRDVREITQKVDRGDPEAAQRAMQLAATRTKQFNRDPRAVALQRRIDKAIEQLDAERAERREQERLDALAAKIVVWTDTAAVPRGFTGTDIEEMYRQLTRAVPSTRRDEYETDDEYVARRKEALSTARVSDHPLTSAFVFLVDDTLRYDVDRGAFESNIWNPLTVASTRTSQGRYVGSNAFGVSKSVERVLAESWVLRFSGSQLHLAKYGFEMERTLAKEMGKSLQTLLVVQLTDPFHESEGETTDPTITAPTAITSHTHAITVSLRRVVVYRKDTGAIVLSKAVPAAPSLHVVEATQELRYSRLNVRATVKNVGGLPARLTSASAAVTVRGATIDTARAPSYATVLPGQTIELDFSFHSLDSEADLDSIEYDLDWETTTMDLFG